jgi:GNAT superfamily N-acetyltransferase
VSRSIRTRNSGFTIRFAEEKDAETVFGMVRELATYEKLLDSLEATEEQFRNSLFHGGVAETILGECDGRVVGYAIFFSNFSTFVGRVGIYIEDLYVKPEVRGRGFGEAMFAYIAKLAVERECGRLEWSCLNWNAPSIAFYEKMGAKRLDDWTMFRLSGKALEQTAGRV